MRGLAMRGLHTGAMLAGTYDNFTDGDPVEFLENLNNHMPTAEYNKLIFIERTGPLTRINLKFPRSFFDIKHCDSCDKLQKIR